MYKTPTLIESFEMPELPVVVLVDVAVPWKCSPRLWRNHLVYHRMLHTRSADQTL